jgi:hypothetical protein
MLSLKRNPTFDKETENRFIELIKEFTDNVYMLQYHAKELHEEEEEKNESRSGVISLKE